MRRPPRFSTGRGAAVLDKLAPEPTPEQRRGAAAWLVDNGHGDLVPVLGLAAEARALAYERLAAAIR